MLGLIYYSFYSLMPRKGAPSSVPETEFSAERALVPLKEITKAPHFIGNDEHARVRDYLFNQLKSLGLQEVQMQEGFIYNNWGGLVRPQNILGKIPGTQAGDALLVFSHYDSALVPSLGASDAGSGVVTILESTGTELSLESSEITASFNFAKSKTLIFSSFLKLQKLVFPQPGTPVTAIRKGCTNIAKGSRIYANTQYLLNTRPHHTT